MQNAKKYHGDNMNLMEYLEKYRMGHAVLTAAEAREADIPFPLQAGWFMRYRFDVVDEDLMRSAHAARLANKPKKGAVGKAMRRIAGERMATVKQPKKAVRAKFSKHQAPVNLPKAAKVTVYATPVITSNYVNTPDFLESFEWRQLRIKVLRHYGAKCMCCGATPASGAVMNVDHIKPRRRFPQLALDFDNLQVLCEDCNHGKSNDIVDFRPVQA